MARLPPADPDDVTAAFEKAVRILNAAAQTRAGLNLKLRRGGYSAAAAEGACGRLVALGYVNDSLYAEALVERRLRQGRGRGLIARELGQKGLDRELVGHSLGSIALADESRSALDLASRLLRRQVPAMAVDRRRGRVLAALGRRGFSASVSRDAVAQAWALLAESPGADEPLDSRP